jgi:hypothetical protein
LLDGTIRTSSKGSNAIGGEVTDVIKERSEKQRLIWIIDFINLNIDELATGDFLKLLAEMQGKLRNLPFFILPSRPKDRKEEFHQLRNIGPGGIILSKAIEKLGRPVDFYYYEDTTDMRALMKSIQLRLRSFLELIYEAKDRSVDDPLEFLFKTNFGLRVAGESISLLPPKSKDDLEYELAQLIFRCSPTSEKAGQGFGDFVHSIKILKKCQAPKRNALCGNFFLQVHKKEKNYCSNQCAWRAYSKFVRDEEKKARAKQKKQRKGG